MQKAQAFWVMPEPISRNNSHIFTALQTINLRPNCHDPMIAFSPAPSLEHNATTRYAKLRHITQSLFGFAIFILVGHEERLSSALPEYEASHRIFIGARPAILAIHLWKSVMAWVIVIKCLVLIKQISFSHQATIDVAFLQVDRCLSVMLNMWNLFTCPFA